MWAGQIQNDGQFACTKGKLWLSLVSLVTNEFKCIYLTNSSTSQITIFLDESLIQELTGWSSSIWSQEGKSFLQSKEILNFKRFWLNLIAFDDDNKY